MDVAEDDILYSPMMYASTASWGAAMASAVIQRLAANMCIISLIKCTKGAFA